MLIGRLTYRAEEAGAFLGGGRRTRLEQCYRGSQPSWLPSVLQVRYSLKPPSQANTTFKIIVHSSCPNYSRAGGLPCACLKIRLQSCGMCSFAFKHENIMQLVQVFLLLTFSVTCSVRHWKIYMLHVKVDKTNLTIWVDYCIYVNQVPYFTIFACALNNI
jgi:hypothetical protein